MIFSWKRKFKTCKNQEARCPLASKTLLLANPLEYLLPFPAFKGSPKTFSVLGSHGPLNLSLSFLIYSLQVNLLVIHRPKFSSSQAENAVFSISLHISRSKIQDYYLSFALPDLSSHLLRLLSLYFLPINSCHFQPSRLSWHFYILLDNIPAFHQNLDISSQRCFSWPWKAHCCQLYIYFECCWEHIFFIKKKKLLFLETLHWFFFFFASCSSIVESVKSLSVTSGNIYIYIYKPSLSVFCDLSNPTVSEPVCC